MIDSCDPREIETAETTPHEFFTRTNALVKLQRLCNQFQTPETREMRAALSQILEETNKKGCTLVISLCGAIGSGLYLEGGDIDIGLFSGNMSREEAEKILKKGLPKKYQRMHIDFWEQYIPWQDLEMIAGTLALEEEVDLNHYHYNLFTRFTYVDGLSEVRMGHDISRVNSIVHGAIRSGRISPIILDICLKKLKVKTPRYYESFNKYLERIKNHPEFKRKKQQEQTAIFQEFLNICQIIFSMKI